MSKHDPIADMLTRIRNAQSVGEKEVYIPASNLKAAILKVLQEEGYIEDFSVNKSTDKNSAKRDIFVTLKYFQEKGVIEKIKRISRPGLRVYRRHDAMPVVRANLGIAIVSTSEGVMTAKNATARKLGGEVLCAVE